MLVSRAAFLRLLGGAVVGLRIDPLAYASGVSLEAVDASQFQPYVGDTFTVCHAGGSVRTRVRLVKVVEPPRTRNVAQFNLVFHGQAGEPFADGIHELSHPSLGSLSIFISPIGAAGGPRVYQACFSRYVRT